MTDDNCLERIPRVANEPVRTFFQRYYDIMPNDKLYPYRVEMELYYDQYICLMLPLVDGHNVLEAINWCVEHVEPNDWFNRGVAFYFTHAADAAFFKLQFSTTTDLDF